MCSHPNKFDDILSILDQASVFSSGKPRKQDASFILEKKKKQETKEADKSHSKSQEEREYAKLIGYEYSDDDDDDFANIENQISNYNNVNGHLSRMRSNRHQVNGQLKRNGYSSNTSKSGIGRGKLLYSSNYDNISSFPDGSFLSKHQRSRQEQNDRVIRDQLRQVIGGGASNELIEAGFNEVFKKKAGVLSEEEDKNCCSSSSTTSSNSTTSKRPEKELYRPPHLRSSNKGADNQVKLEKVVIDHPFHASVFQESSKLDTNLLHYNDKSPQSLNLGASKVPCIYEGGLDYSSHDKEFEEPDIEDVEIIDENTEIKEPKFMFKVQKKEDSEGFKIKARRNALICSLLKNNTELSEAVDEINRGEVIDRSTSSSFNSIAENCAEEANSTVNVNNTGSSSHYESYRPMISSIRVNNSLEVSDCDRYATSCSPKQAKGYVETVLENDTRKIKRSPKVTLGDYLLLDSYSSNSSECSFSGSIKSLNPDASEFVPNFLSDPNEGYDFNLNDDNFPPL